MEDKLLKVKYVFDKVKDMRSELNLLFSHLDSRLNKLSEIYDDFIKNTNMIRSPDVKALIFSLDSFYFQNSLLRREYTYLKDYYNIIINRMYGEYYKLFKIINEYVNRSLSDNKINEVLKNKNYPRYDDLNDEKVYDFKLITQINEDIMNVINYLINILRDKEISLRQYTTNQEYGLNVNNFVSTYKYDVIVLQEQISLYEKYLDFFYHVHEKLLMRLITKVSVLEAQLNTDIKFEGGLIGKKKDNQVLFEEIGMSGLNKKTARELRRSITGSSKSVDFNSDTEIENERYYSETSDSSDITFDMMKTNDCIPPPSSPNSSSHVSFDSDNSIDTSEYKSNEILPTSAVSKIFESCNNIDVNETVRVTEELTINKDIPKQTDDDIENNVEKQQLQQRKKQLLEMRENKKKGLIKNNEESSEENTEEETYDTSKENTEEASNVELVVEETH
jgi:hypothetical protein